MSWDAELVDAAGSVIGAWNYTHNTNVMADLVLDPETDTGRTVFDALMDASATSWWRQLDGTDGADGASLLDRIIAGLRADPARFQTLNPSNGWGDYGSFLAVLTEMREAVPAGGPSRWIVSG